MQESKEKFLVFVTGQSGSGLCTAIRTLEDLGFYCIDNLPFDLVLPTVTALETKVDVWDKGIVLGVRVHSLAQAKAFGELQTHVRKKVRMETLYLVTQDNVLLSRFGTTRRKHPYIVADQDLLSAIHREKDVLKIVESHADHLIDTTDFNPHDLASYLEKRYCPGAKPRKLFVSITSFGFKYGPCTPSDTLFDLRFLKNPFFIPELKDRNGLDPEVMRFVLEDHLTRSFLDRFVDFNSWLIPHYYDEGKHYFRIGLGCTGGKHRSVCIAEYLGAQLKLRYPNLIDLKVSHRDLLL